SQPDGWDFEKSRYIPGIYDSVELILSGTPHITSVQTVPLVQEKAVLVVAKVLNAARPTEIELRARVLEAKGDKEVGSAISGPIKLVGGEGRQIDLLIPIENCRLWSPEDPFLYRLELDTGCDRQSVRFGVRSFSFDPQTKMPLLNGKPYPLRGTNVCIFRFFEDSQRKDLPWREAWVRRLHKLFKEMHWNSCRYCIGFPPERWYDIADEEGILIQDEFPIWYLQQWPAELKAEALMPEYQAWMRERWNHPCVVIWDAQNETKTEETGKAIRAVRGQDLSSRPWDNGWGPPDQPTDVYEAHPYFFGGKTGTKNRLSQLGNKPGAPGVPNGLRGAPRLNTGGNPTIINEYCWLWLTRDGLPTTLTKPNYEIFLGPKSTVEERRQLYNRVLAAKTEFWRCRRQVAGVLHFCALGYSRHDGQTSDHFTDVEKLELEPNFRKYVRSAFSPVGLMVDYWAEQTPLAPLQVPVVVINDLPEAWNGRVRLELQDDKGKRVVHSAEKECSVASIGQETLSFELPAPKSPGEYLLAAKLTCAGEEVLSVREVRVEAPAPAKPAPSTAGPASPATKPPPPGKSTRPARAE
ncbi:MAG: glycoside hydrolase family 2 TIM barrel-domain containing protein, partial [Planctomycetota bacterium]